MKTLDDLREQFEDGEIVSMPPGTPGTVQFLGPNMHSAMFSGLNVMFRGGQFTTDNDELIGKLHGLTKRSVGITEVVAVVQPSGEVVAVATTDKDAAAKVVTALQNTTQENAPSIVTGDTAGKSAAPANAAVAAAIAAARASGSAPQA